MILACAASDQSRYETTHNRKGSCHLNELMTLAIKPLTLHDYFVATAYYLSTHFPAINRELSEIFEHVQNVKSTCDSLRLLEL